MNPRQIASEIRRLRGVSMPYSVTFLHGIPKESAKTIEDQLKTRFENWYDTWILPLASHLDPKAKATFANRR